MKRENTSFRIPGDFGITTQESRFKFLLKIRQLVLVSSQGTTSLICMHSMLSTLSRDSSGSQTHTRAQRQREKKEKEKEKGRKERERRLSMIDVFVLLFFLCLGVVREHHVHLPLSLFLCSMQSFCFLYTVHMTSLSLSSCTGIGISLYRQQTDTDVRFSMNFFLFIKLLSYPTRRLLLDERLYLSVYLFLMNLSVLNLSVCLSLSASILQYQHTPIDIYIELDKQTSTCRSLLLRASSPPSTSISVCMQYDCLSLLIDREKP